MESRRKRRGERRAATLPVITGEIKGHSIALESRKKGEGGAERPFSLVSQRGRNRGAELGPRERGPTLLTLKEKNDPVCQLIKKVVGRFLCSFEEEEKKGSLSAREGEYITFHPLFYRVRERKKNDLPQRSEEREKEGGMWDVFLLHFYNWGKGEGRGSDDLPGDTKRKEKKGGTLGFSFFLVEKKRKNR